MSTVTKFRRKTEADPLPDRLLGIPEAAVMLAKTQKALRHDVARRRIPFMKLGKRIVFSERALLNFITGLPKFEVTAE